MKKTKEGTDDVGHHEPRILTIDAETTALRIRAWGIWEQNAIRVDERSHVLCVSYKWMDEKKVHNISMRDDPKYKPGVMNDRYVIEKVRDLLDEADIVVTQNGISFDIPIFRGKMAEYGIPPFSPFRNIDTKVLSKKLFRFESNKLEDLVKYMKLDHKTNPGGFGVWEGCERGDPKSWNLMEKYCDNDVAITEKYYLRIRPYMEQHPNLNVITGRLSSCKGCGKPKPQARGWGYTNTAKYRKYQCVGADGCGLWNRGKNEPLVKVTNQITMR